MDAEVSRRWGGRILEQWHGSAVKASPQHEGGEQKAASVFSHLVVTLQKSF